ncbi:MAG TPA: hypothetical protein VEC57_20885 [Candidatus Limnocylindrales bacterium]|nr:hypothetical protein [Candidatus Limnocylindrales bacterium]
MIEKYKAYEFTGDTEVYETAEVDAELARLRERVAELERGESLLRLQIEAMEDCIARDEDQPQIPFEERAEELIVTEINHQNLLERERLLLEAVRWLHVEWEQAANYRNYEPPPIPEELAPLIAEAVGNQQENTK